MLPNDNLKNTFPRLLSLDVFRGITIILMILVNSPGNRTSYNLLEHSVWHGCTLADLVFPFFIFIVGVSSALTLSKQRAQGLSFNFLLWKITKRTLFLFFLGLLLNAISLHVDWSTFRFMGVLQRIAICYFFTSLLYLTTRLQTQAILIGVLLIGYWLAMSLLPVSGISGASFDLSMDGNLATYIDRLFITPAHLYTSGFDPEGLFSTLPAIATALLGNLLGAYLLLTISPAAKLKGMVLAGSLLALIGWIWGFYFPINKALWTSSYVLWTGGLAILSFALCYWLIEIRQWKTWSKPFEIFGVTALLAYVLHVLFLKIQAMILVPLADGRTVNLRLFITQTVFPLSDLKLASLLYAISYTLFWFMIIFFIYCKKRANSRKLRLV
jgi:predicted acyltransferase